MTDPIVAVRTYLDAKAVAASDSIRAFGGVPNPRPARFIRLMRVGTVITSVAHRDVRIVAECWNTAGQLAANSDGDMVQGWLAAMAGADGHVPQGERGWIGGPYEQPDPDSECPRSVMTFILRQRRV